MSAVLADTPSEFKSRQIKSAKAKYCAQILEDEALIYKRTCVIGELFYAVPGRHLWSIVTDDGEFFISFLNGYNLLPRYVEQTTEVVRIWKRNKLLHTIQLQHLIDDLDKLEGTASHFYWGQVIAVKSGILLFDTVEGEKELELYSGEVKLVGTGKAH